MHIIKIFIWFETIFLNTQLTTFLLFVNFIQSKTDTNIYICC